MAILQSVDLITNALWPQGDIRDPLGVWGARQGITGDASGGSIKVIIRAPAAEKAAYLFTCYDVNISQLTGTIVAEAIKCRLLTNWPNIDPVAGVQSYGSNYMGVLRGNAGFTAPIAGFSSDSPILPPNSRYLLLFDPRPAGSGELNIIELEVPTNTDTETWSFETYGYYWDRSVLNAPGGPRHPGAGAR